MVQNLVGLTLASLYTFEEASGNVVDLVGGHDLIAGGTPMFGQAVGGKVGIKYDTNGDFHRADVHDFGVTSAWFAAVVHIGPTINATEALAGRWITGGTTGALLYTPVPASGTCGLLVRDAGANELLLAPAGDMRGKQFLVQCQIDRAASTARYRAKVRGEAAVVSSGSIAGFGSLFESGQVFGFGTLPSLNAGHITAFFGAVATGAQCEGADLLARIEGRMGFA